MDIHLKPLLSSDVDFDHEDEDCIPSSSDAPPRYDAPVTSQSVEDEDADFVKWWKEVRSQPPQRDSLLGRIRAWSLNDRRRNAIVARDAMVAHATLRFVVSTLLFGTFIFFLYINGMVSRDKDAGVVPTVLVALMTIFFLLSGMGFLWSGVCAAHIACRVHRSLRARNVDATADQARIYIPPVAILVRGFRFSSQSPFYRPYPFVSCDNLHELGARISALEVRLRAHERNSTDPFGLLSPV